MKKGIYQEAHDYFISQGKEDLLNTYNEAGRIMTIGMYLWEVNGGKENVIGDGRDIHYGFRGNRLNKVGEELNSPPVCGFPNQCFEDVVEEEFGNFGYSETLNISIEDCQSGNIDIDDVEEVLEYLLKLMSEMTKTDARGVFWVIEGNLHSFPFTDDYPEGIAKSGNTYNHKKLWQSVKAKPCGNKPYNYYPRGRVDISSKGKPIIYLNPNIDVSFIPQIESDFGLTESPELRYDHSEHYRCYLDDGWKPEKK